jgi:hypothetical protein
MTLLVFSALNLLSREQPGYSGDARTHDSREGLDELASKVDVRREPGSPFATSKHSTCGRARLVLVEFVPVRTKAVDSVEHALKEGVSRDREGSGFLCALPTLDFRSDMVEFPHPFSPQDQVCFEQIENKSHAARD